MNQRENARPMCRLIDWLLLLIFCASLSGCAVTRETNRVFQMAKRTTHVEPKYFEYIRSDRVAQREARLLAEQAWGEVGLPNASPDYKNGFLEGFSDYLYRGGEGQPPVIPPRGYWNLRFLNQFGKSSVNDWYEGFRQGAQDCKSRGLREMWVVPTSLIADPEKPSAPSNWADDDMWQQKTFKQEKDPLERLRDPESPPVPSADDGQAGADDYSGDSDDEMGAEDSSPEPSDDNDIDRTDPFGDERRNDDDDTEESQLRMREQLPANDAADGDDPADDGDDGFPDPFDSLPANEPANGAAKEPAGAKDSFDMDDLFPDANSAPAGNEPSGFESDDLQPTGLDDDPFSQLGPGGNNSNRANFANRTVRQTAGYENAPQGTGKPRVNTLRRQREANSQRVNQRTNNRRTKKQTSANTRNSRNVPRGSQQKPFYSRELMIMDSVPAIPLEINSASSPNTATNVPNDVIVWDPMEGVDEPPEFDVLEFDNLVDDQAIDNSTKWTPAMTRATELPPRIADRRMRVTPKNNSVQPIDRPKFVPNSSNIQLRDQLRMALDSKTKTTRSSNSSASSNSSNAGLPPIVDRISTQPIRNDKNAIQFRINDTE